MTKHGPPLPPEISALRDELAASFELTMQDVEQALWSPPR
jgi:hypothetical protein